MINFTHRVCNLLAKGFNDSEILQPAHCIFMIESSLFEPMASSVTNASWHGNRI